MAASSSSVALSPFFGLNPSMLVTTSDGQHQLRATHDPLLPEPLDHAPWKLKKVIAGHTGWVRAISMDAATNTWFATGSADRTIKIWDFPSGNLKLTLTGHISTVRALAVSDRYPYLFSGGEDRKVLCWDLEQNKVVRHFHGHFHGVYAAALHPRLDLLVTGSRDGSARVWDLRTKSTVHLLTGHRSTVSAVLTGECDPQVITGSQDTEIRLWDIRQGSTVIALTQHKKGIRALAAHPTDWCFVSGGADGARRYALPDAIYLQTYDRTFSQKEEKNSNDSDGRELVLADSILDCLAINEDGVVFGGAEDGRMMFWDYGSGRCFQQEQAIPQPGSMDCEAGVLAATFDGTGMRLLTAEVDKTIKIWAQQEDHEEVLHQQ